MRKDAQDESSDPSLGVLGSFLRYYNENNNQDDNHSTRSFTMKTIIVSILTLGLMTSTAFAHCGACGVEKKHDHATTASVEADLNSIIETAKAAGSFKTLLDAVEAAELSETLSGEGPFTVFAPTDAAFAALPKGTIESLLKDKAKLASILAYHVVDGSVKSEEVVKLDEAETLNGQSVNIKVVDGEVMIDQARVTTTDIVCSNGVIHVIDAVMLPKSTDSEG
jgi:uncharacterized surface protein with fasciclin (FAS1) repeats